MKVHPLKLIISLLAIVGCLSASTIYVDNSGETLSTSFTNSYTYTATSLDAALDQIVSGSDKKSEYILYVRATNINYAITNAYNLTGITLTIQKYDSTGTGSRNPVSSFSACSQVPDIVVHNASIIATKISFFGVGFVTASNATNSLFLSLQTASISNVCFQIDSITQPLDSSMRQTSRIELDDSPSSDWMPYFLSINGTDSDPGDWTLQNIYISGSIASPFLLWSQHMNTLTISSFNSYSVPRMMITTNKTYVTGFNVDGSSSGSTLISDPTTNPCFTKISYYASMTWAATVIKNLATSNTRYFICIYQVSPPDDVVLTPSTQTFIMNTLTFQNNSFHEVTTSWSFFYLKYSSGSEVANRATTFQNLNILNNVAVTNTSDYSSFNCFLIGMDLAGTLTLNTGTFQGNTDFKFVFAVMNDAIPSSLSVFKSFTFTQNFWELGNLPVLDITVNPKITATAPASVATKVSDLTITRNSFYREFLYYDNQGTSRDATNGNINPRVWMTNIRLTENDCVYTNMFVFQRLHVDFNNSLLARNNLYYTNILKSTTGPTPLQMNNITADSNMLSSTSSIVLKQMDTSKVVTAVDANSENNFVLPYSILITNFFLTNTTFSEESRGFWIKGAPVLIIANCTFKDLTFSSSSTLISASDLLSSVSNAIFDKSLTLQTGYLGYLKTIGNPNLTNAFYESFPMGDQKAFALNYTMGSMINSLVFIYRVYGSKFQNLTFDKSFMIEMSNVLLNQSQVSIDKNTFTGISLDTFQDSLVSSASVQALNFGFNTLQSMSGIGASLSGSETSYLTISNNTVATNNGTSFLRLSTETSYNILVSGNTIQSGMSVATFLKIEIGTNYGSILFKDNIFNDILVSSDESAYRQLNFLQVDTESAISYQGSTPGLYIRNCNFTNIVLLKNHRLIKQYQNAFLVASLSQDLFQVENSLFNNISIRYDNNLLFIVSDSFKMMNTTISNIENFEKYGPVYALSNNFYVNNSQFINNTALIGKGGAIYFDFDAIQGGAANIQIENSLFKNNIASEGSAFYLYKTQVNFTSSNNTFTNCSVSPGLKGSLMSFISTTFAGFQVERTVVVYPQETQQLLTVFNFDSIQTGDSTLALNVSDLNFTIDANLAGTLFGVQGTKASFSINNVTVFDIRENKRANSGTFSIMDIASGTIAVKRLNISSMTTDTSSLLYISCSKEFDSILDVQNSKFENIIIAQSSKNTNATNFGIFHISNKGNRATCQNKLIMANVIFDQLNEGVSEDLRTSSAILADYSGRYTLTVKDSVFSNLFALKGPAINLQDTSKIGNQITLTNNQFTNTTSLVDGGAIYNTNDALLMEKNSFINSAALTGNGGAVYSKENVDFSSIKAQNAFINCTRYGNFNFADGLPLGTAPVVLNLVVSTPSYINLGFLTNGSTVLTNFSSYDFTNFNVSAVLVDGLGQVVYDTVYNDTNPRTISLSISEQSADSRDCDYQQCQMIGPNLPLKVPASQYIPGVIAYKSSTYQVSSAAFFVVLRHCINGEINTTLVNPANPPQCTPCAPNYYSIDTLTDKSCSSCPEHATCLGGNSLVLDAGYWRASTLTDSIVACRTESSCLGGFQSTCRAGFKGPLCDSCDSSMRYVKNGETCGFCPSYGQSLLISLAFMIGMFGYQIWYIKSVRESNSFFIAYFGEKTDHEHGLRIELKINQGMYIRLFTTYYQIYGIISTFELDFSQLLGISSTDSSSSKISTLFYSNACSLIDLGLDGSKFVYYSLTLNVLSPIIKIIILAIFRAFLWKFNINEKRKSILVVTAVCLFLLEQPAIVQGLFSFLRCVQVNGDPNYYLEGDMGYQCYTSGYNSFKKFFVYPAIAFYVLIIPGLMIFILYTHYKRNDLNNVKLRMDLGAIYNEYHPRAFFWGIYLMLTKLILMYLQSSFYGDVKSRALSVFVVLYVYYASYLKLHPYDKKDLYMAEKITLITYLFTIFGSIYYKDNTLPIVQWITLFIIAVLNIYVIGLLLLSTLRAYVIQLKVFVLPIIKRKITRQDNIISLDVNFLDQDFTNSKEDSLEQVEDRIFGKDDDNKEVAKPPHKETELPVL